jgi:sterol 3beta-glucosyltransferase
MGGGYNYMTYTIFDNLFWKASAGQINRWRKRHLGLRSTNLDKMQVNKVPFLYNFSPSVVPPPLDWVDWIIVTGYWFLDDADSTASKKWEPPQDIVDFIAKARQDDKKIVYIGFGSIVVSDPKALTETVIESVKNAGVRCILSKGWSDRLGDKNAQKTEVPLPDYILSVQSAPHDWLFPQIDAAVHHGGAGTTGASLRAGLVTVIKPYFGDQYFWANRVEDLGVGLSIRKLNVGNFSKALKDATSNQKMIAKAKALGELIRKVHSFLLYTNFQENGVATAIQAIYRDMEYAKSLIKQRDSPAPDTLSDESWTVIDDEKSPVEELPEFKSARFQDKNDESRLGRLSKKFNLSTATTTLNPIGWNRALKQRNEQKRHELEGRPSELDVADVKTIHGGD